MLVGEWGVYLKHMSKKEVVIPDEHVISKII